MTESLIDKKVVSISGGEVTAFRGEPVPKVIEDLEWALREAKSGNMQGLAMAYVIADGTGCPITSGVFAHAQGSGRLLDSAIHGLQRSFGRYLDE